MKKILTICTGFLSLAAAHCMQETTSTPLIKMDNYLVDESLDEEAGVASLIIYDRRTFRFSDGHPHARRFPTTAPLEEQEELLQKMAAKLTALCATCTQRDFWKAARFLTHVNAPEARSALYKRFRNDPALQANDEIARVMNLFWSGLVVV